MRNSDITRIFANGNREVKTKHLFIEGNSIYSYGYHFKIAKKTSENTADFTTRRYSVTTSKHKYYVKRALLEAGYILTEIEL